MMWYWGGGLHWWGWLLGFLGMIVFWGVVLWLVWYFVVAIIREPHRSRDGVARQILDERLARGELDPEEYRRLRDLISGAERDEPVGTGPAGRR